jgi:hypothetical protein
VKSWDVKRNGDLTPSAVVAGSAKKVYWLCPKGHSIHIEIRSKVKGAGCGVCANRVLLPGVNDLATVHPEIASQWHSEKNGKLLPSQVLAGARKRIWWQCKNGHEWEASLDTRNPKTSGCARCLNKVVIVGENDLSSKFPLIAKEWDAVRNSKTPKEVSSGSQSVVFWTCPNGHSYKTTVYKRTILGQGCKFCSGAAILSGHNDLATLYPEIAAKFHPSLNSPTITSELASHSKKRFVWICPKGHNFTSTPRQLVIGYGCGVCSGVQIQPGLNDLLTRVPRLAAEWDYELNGDLNPTMISGGSALKVWWICPLGHHYQMRIDNRVFLNRQCGVCGNRQVEIGVNDLQSQRPELSREWDLSKNQPLKPSGVTFESTKKVWWLCDEGHSFKSQINWRANRGVGCPNCAKSGFDQSSAATFYFIENLELGARKIGIANQSSDRLEKWRKRGWKLVWQHESEDGKSVLDLETKVLRWIRKDLGLPPHLGDQELGAIGGWSETFSSEGVTNEVLLTKIDFLLGEIAANRESS